MAHAGTTSTSSGQTGLWKALLTAVVIAAIGIGMVLAVPYITGGKAASAPAVDNSYNQIEAQRGTISLWGVAPDNSLDAAVRAAAAKGAVSAGTSHNAVENLRAQSGVTVDTTYNAAEKARGGAFSGTTIDPSTFDRTPRGAHGQLP
jgi:hypothetical protein